MVHRKERSNSSCAAYEGTGNVKRRHQHPLGDLSRDVFTTCMMTAGDEEVALQTHALWEVGGNIGKLSYCTFLSLSFLS